ncbi:hypothetical protein Tco_0548104 [Tanacetum coccineum]
MVYVVNGVHVSGVDIILEKDFVHFVLQKMGNSSESSIPLRDIISELPLSVAITPDLPTLEPEDSLIMGNEDLSTIPEKESDEFIKSSVEDLVPIPSESEDTSESDSDCDLPSCDDFSPINVYEEKSMTFSNPLFDSNDDFTSSDDESLSDEDVPEDNVKIYSNPLFEFDDEYISSDVNPLFDEVLEDIESEDSYVSKLDEPDLLVIPLSAFNEDECFDPRGDIDEIDAFLDIVVSTDIVDDYYDSEGDIIYLESLLIKNTTPNLPPKVTDMSKMDKNKAKRTKPSTGMERVQEIKAEGIFIFNGPTRTHFNGPEMLNSLSAPIYYRALDTTTLRELIDSEGKLIPEVPEPVITEYLVNISKRRAFWSLNEDILKITILTTNTPYPSRKIRRIRACTHQRPQRKEDQYAVSRRPIRRIGNIVCEYSGRYQTWSLLQETPNTPLRCVNSLPDDPPKSKEDDALRDKKIHCT